MNKSGINNEELIVTLDKEQIPKNGIERRIMGWRELVQQANLKRRKGDLSVNKLKEYIEEIFIKRYEVNPNNIYPVITCYCDKITLSFEINEKYITGEGGFIIFIKNLGETPFQFKLIGGTLHEEKFLKHYKLEKIDDRLYKSKL